MSTIAERRFSIFLSFDLTGADPDSYEILYDELKKAFGFRKIATFNGVSPSTTVGGYVNAPSENSAAHTTNAAVERIFKDLGLKGEIFILACTSASWASAKVE